MHVHIKIMHTFCNALIYLKPLPFNCAITAVFLCYISSKILISILSHLHTKLCSLILQAQDVRLWYTSPIYANKLCIWIYLSSKQAKWKITTWLYSYHCFLVCVLQGQCKQQWIQTSFSETTYKFSPSTLSEHQRTQDTQCTNEPSPSIPLFEHWKRQHNQREAEYKHLHLYFNC